VAKGFRVPRFTNSELMNEDHVLGQILEAVEAPPVFEF
jgi:very-short-patch-repair endonuclease